MPSSEAIHHELDKLLEQSEPEKTRWLKLFAKRLFARIPASAQRRLSPQTCAALVRAALEEMLLCRAEPVRVKVANQSYDGHSFGVIETLMPDRPFIVATIEECLRELHLPVAILLHPVLRVARDSQGRLISLEQGAVGEQPESFVHVELTVALEDAMLEDVADELKARLEEVLLVTGDFDQMTERVIQIGEELAAEQGLPEVRDFIHWLVGGGFIFLGYRRYELRINGGQRTIAVVRGSGLGIMRAEQRSRFWTPQPIDGLGDATLKLLFEGPIPFVTKTRAKSNVHRRRAMDDIIIRRQNRPGEIVAFDRIVGLFTTKASSEEAEQIPIIRQKVAQILSEEGVAVGSHDFERLRTILNTFPREELFRASTEELRAQLAAIVDFREENECSVACWVDQARQMAIVLVVLAASRYSSELHQKIRDTFAFKFKAQPIYDHPVAVSEDVAARIHFCFPNPRGEAPDFAQLQDELVKLTRTWEDRLEDELVAHYGDTVGRRLAARYRRAFSSDYQATTDVARAVQDIQRIETAISRKTLEVEVSPSRERQEHVSELRVYETGQPVVLSDLLPQLRNFGVRVLYEDAHEVHLPQGECAFVQVFAVQTEQGRALASTPGVDLFPQALVAVRKGLSEDDPLNQLTLRARLSWREVSLLRAYVTVAVQMGLGPTLESLRRVLINYPELAQLLVAIFKARLAPERDAAPDELARLHSNYAKAREQVETLADDLAARNLLSLVEATVRTNYFRQPEETHITLKFESRRVTNLHGVVPLYEIHVVSPTMAGCHLRAGKIARGGIRFSDRLDDYRVEILELMKTQTVKNAIIVPVGAKGGFIVKSRDRRQPEPHAVVEAYQTLIGAMLDVTSNLVDGQLVAPARVKVLDDDGPYLVVAADKGTATFSDIANELARIRGFWLDDAFASGGKHGYDHKRLGITARGAWESAKRHFRELGRDLERGAPITVVGIGDMSGDVFGNGMLQSANIKLLAAFDARHIFIDPDPDPETSYRERRRLFEMPNSSWRDYDPKLISRGGGVFPRSHKAIPISPEARAALGIEADVLDGEALIRAILRAPVDMLYNGGIGTYVRASSETDAEVGDHANDSCRITARELRAKVVVEGGNLGLTQKARVEFALKRGKINTDAIDNSAGVNMSDHEVNLKILFAPMVKRGELSLEERNAILEAVTDEVVEHVLEDNRAQALLLSLEEARSRAYPTLFCDLVADLEARGVMRREIEALPTHEEIERRRTQGVGFTRPELAVLAAYTKLALIRELEDSAFADSDEKYLDERFLMPYFPAPIRQRFGAQIPTHQLRAPLLITRLVNELVNHMGAGFVFDLCRRYSRSCSDVVRAWLVASDLIQLKQRLSDLQARLSGFTPDADINGSIAVERSCRKACEWLLMNYHEKDPIAPSIERFGPLLKALIEVFEDRLVTTERARFEAVYRDLRRAGLDARTAHELAKLSFIEHLLSIAALSQEAKVAPEEVASAYFGLVSEVDFGTLENALSAFNTDDPWEQRALRELGEDLLRARYRLARSVLGYSKGADWSEGLRAVRAEVPERFQEAASLLDKIRGLPAVGLGALQVTIRAVARLAHA